MVAGIGVERGFIRGRGMKPKSFLLVGLFLAALSHADTPSGAEVALPNDPVTASPEVRPVKSHAVAYAWVVGATVIPIAIAYPMLNKDNPTDREDIIGWPLMISGILIGPSVGQFYAGSWVRGIGGILFRSASAYGLMMAFSDCPLFDNGDESCGETGERVAAGIYVVGALYSLIDTYFAVNRANERARRRYESRTSLSPILLPVRDDRRITGLAPGLALSARF